MSDPRTALQAADAALRAGRPAACLDHCEQLLEAHPARPPALFLKGVALLELGRPADAVEPLQQVRARQPGDRHSAFYLGRALRLAGRHREALDPLESAAGEAAYAVAARYELGVACTRLGRTEDAVAHYRALLDREPGHADAAANLAALLEQLSQLDEARQWTESALAARPDHPGARLTLGTLQRRAGDLETAADTLRAVAADVPRGRLNHALALNQLGHVLDRLERFHEAFEAFDAANRALASWHPDAVPDPRGSYSIETLRQLEEWLGEHRSGDWTETPDDPEPPPIFLLGFPRSGTTLLDRALDAHPALHVLEEEELLAGVRERWVDGGALENLHQLVPDQVLDARRMYRAAAREAAGERAPGCRLVDKLPLNSAYLPLIHRLFPDALVIRAVRDPRDACLSCWMQMFDLVGAMPYFLDLDDTARYYDSVARLLASTLDRLPVRVHEVRYEDLVTDLPASVRGVLDFLDLPWDDQVLSYRERLAGQRIATPSYGQVAQPLYTRSIGRWRHYSDHLEGPFAPLEPWVRALGYPS